MNCLIRPRRNVCAQCILDLRRYGARRWVHKSTLDRKRAEEEVWQMKAQRIRKGEQQSMLSILEERGYINQIAGDRAELDQLLTSKRLGAYVGVDPTASSLHVGHLLPMMALFWMYLHGYRANILLGGATAKIGDPTGRLTTRERVSGTERKVMLVAIHWQLKTLWANVEAYSRKYGYETNISNVRGLLNNSHWLGKLSIMDAMREMGPAFRIGRLLSRDTVKLKMEKGDGVSLPEFLYPVLQAWDWWHLYEKQGVQVQIGGSDQYGNILTGMDGIKWAAKHKGQPEERIDLEKTPAMKVFGMTTPLLTTTTGEKLGKSAGNAVWLERSQTSSFELYQYFLRIPDADVSRYLKLLTFMPLSEIETLVADHETDPTRRVAQHRLARDVLELVHGPLEAAEAEAQHRFVFGNSSQPSQTTGTKNILEIEAKKNALSALGNPETGRGAHFNMTNMPSGLQTTLPISLVRNQRFARVLYSAGLVVSRSEGERVIRRGGAYVGSKSDGSGNMGDDLNFTPISTHNPEETWNFVIDDSLMVLRVGKWRAKIVRIVSDEEFEERGLDCPGWKVSDSTDERWKEVEKESDSAESQAEAEERKRRKQLLKSH